MKKSYLLTSLAIAFSVAAFSQATLSGTTQTTVAASAAAAPANRLKLSVAQPVAGKTFSFTYSAKNSKLEGVKKISAALFYYTGNVVSTYYASDIALTANGLNEWKGSVNLPDSAVAFALRFKAGENLDNNDGQGFIYIANKNGAVPAGGYGGAGLLYGNGRYTFNLSNKTDTALALLEKEFALHPESKGKYAREYYYFLSSAKKQAAYPQFEADAAKLLAQANPTADDYKTAVLLYNLQRKRKGSDSLLALAAAKFPQGELAIQYDENKFYEIKDVDSLVQFYDAFVQKYPASTNPKDPARQTATYFAASLASKYLENKQYEKAAAYASKIDESEADYRGYIYNKISAQLIKEKNNPALAESLASQAIAAVENELAHPEKYKRESSTLSDWKEDINKYYYSAFLDNYATVLAEKNEPAKALALQQKAIELGGGEQPAFNEHYVKYLLQTGNKQKAYEKEETYIREGQATDTLKQWFKEAYLAKNGASADVAGYLAKLESAAKTKIREEALKAKIDLPAKDFVAPDLAGTDVNLAALRGKVVIVDFWATWCGPCKASFPGMQKAVNKFKNDTNVVFLFVDTWESVGGEERHKLVKKFITDNSYTFRVVLDKLVDLEKRSYSVVADYGVDGIPTKFVISPEGKIVFKAVGFDGNDEKLLNEISAYIDIAKG